MSYAAWAGVALGAYSVWKQGEDAKRRQDASDQSQSQYESETIEGTRRFEIGEDWKRAEWRRDQGQLEYSQGLEQDRYGQAQDWQRTAWEQGLNQREAAEMVREGNIARLDPYSRAGREATDEQAALMGLRGTVAGEEAMGRFSESPGQKFMRQRAEKSLLRSSSAIGGLGGGNVRSALVEQGVGFAQQDYDNRLRRLSGLSGRGLQAGQTITGMGTDFGTGGRIAAPEALNRRALPRAVGAPLDETLPGPSLPPGPDQRYQAS